jgi:hypothetical protein
MRHPALAFLIALALAACGSPRMTREDMESWDGKSFRQLVEAWGVPDPQQTRYYFWAFRGTQGSVSVPDVEGSSPALGKGTGDESQPAAKTSFPTDDRRRP